MNPFKKDGQMLPIASINSVYVDDVLASDLFRPELIVNEIKKDRDFLGFSSDISNDNLLVEFNCALNNKSSDIREKAQEIAVHFGKKLASVLITLKNPSLKSVANRPSWTNEHWAFWKEVKEIYFVGGLTSPILTTIFYNQIIKKFKEQKITDLDISFVDGSVDLGTKGLATLTIDGEYLLFDFGQTSIKRRHILRKQNKIVINPFNKNLVRPASVCLRLGSEYLTCKSTGLINVSDNSTYPNYKINKINQAKKQFIIKWILIGFSHL